MTITTNAEGGICAYPIFPFEEIEDGLVEIDTEVGTAFFISHHGLFLTAKHVVETCVQRGVKLRVIVIARGRYVRLPIASLLLHPILDAAIGHVPLEVPQDWEPPTFALGTSQLRSDTPIAIYGYSSTQLTERPSEKPDTPPGLHISFNPSFYAGKILEHHARGVGLTRGWPIYSHTADTLGGISGGPMVNVNNSAVYGINCSGFEGYGTATDIGPLLDWAIPFAGGQTLRELAAKDFLKLKNDP